jgi:hypothetical protein
VYEDYQDSIGLKYSQQPNFIKNSDQRSPMTTPMLSMYSSDKTVEEGWSKKIQERQDKTALS